MHIINRITKLRQLSKAREEMRSVDGVSLTPPMILSKKQYPWQKRMAVKLFKHEIFLESKDRKDFQKERMIKNFSC